MKYFVKYLPVEGEIKEGDLVCWWIGDKHGEIFKAVGIGYRPPKYKITKLFLCSRDIQVGDKIWFTGLDGQLKQGTFYHATALGNETIVDLTPEGEGTGFLLGSDGFKVIGEISPDATWVKEGDQFISEGWECEVFPNHTHRSSGKIVYLDMNDKELPEEALPIYKIKCPTCRTFH